MDSISISLADGCVITETEDVVNVGNLTPTCPRDCSESWESGSEKQGRVTVVRPPSTPFGWKVIPLAADAASVPLRANLECLNIQVALNGFVSNMEHEGKWKSQHL